MLCAAHRMRSLSEQTLTWSVHAPLTCFMMDSSTFLCKSELCLAATHSVRVIMCTQRDHASLQVPAACKKIARQANSNLTPPTMRYQSAASLLSSHPIAPQNLEYHSGSHSRFSARKLFFLHTAAVRASETAAPARSPFDASHQSHTLRWLPPGCRQGPALMTHQALPSRWHEGAELEMHALPGHVSADAKLHDCRDVQQLCAINVKRLPIRQGTD